MTIASDSSTSKWELTTETIVTNEQQHLPNWHFEVSVTKKKLETVPLVVVFFLVMICMVAPFLFHLNAIKFFLKFQGVSPLNHKQLPNETVFSFPTLESLEKLDLGTYYRQQVSNVDGVGRRYFDFGLRLMMSYQHELAAKCFLACLEHCPHCALAHGFIAICHSPNYNFKGDPYYESTSHYDDALKHDLLCVFPSQQVADRHSRMAMEKIEELRKMKRNTTKRKTGKKGKKQARVTPPPLSSSSQASKGDDNDSSDGDSQPTVISEIESQLLSAIRVLTCCPGVDPALSTETVGRPYTNAMRKLYQKYPDDPEIIYCFAESLMVLNAWQLFEYPSGKPASPDVEETQDILERALQTHKEHAGLCHLYVHLSEMSAHPEKALTACESLRHLFPDAGTYK